MAGTFGRCLALCLFGCSLLLAVRAQQSATTVYCYMGGGYSSTNGSTLSLQNTCASNTSCFLTINSDNSWRSGCKSPPNYPSNLGPANGTFCQASPSPAFCQCTANFCNTPNNMAFLSALNSTLTNIVKPADPGNLTCFECGAPYVWGPNGTRSFAPFNISCDGTKYCSGKYCVTRKSQFPRSYCATSWEDPKMVQCQTVTDPYDTQECICNQTYCNYPYDALNPPPPTTTTTTTTTTIAPTTQAPSPWQCVNSCGQIQLVPGTFNATVGNGSYVGANGCQMIYVSCATTNPTAVVAFGSLGNQSAFAAPYTSVSALLYCLNVGGQMMWTRFGVDGNPNAMVQPVTQAQCIQNQLPAPTATTTMQPPVSTTPPPPIVNTVNNTVGPWMCTGGCTAGQVMLSPRAVGNATVGNGTYMTGTCMNLMVSCQTPYPTAIVAFGAGGHHLRAFQANYTSVSALLYCIQQNGTSNWTRFGTTRDPNAMITVTEAHCDSDPPLTTTAPPTTPPPTTPPPTTTTTTPPPTTTTTTPPPTTTTTTPPPTTTTTTPPPTTTTTTPPPTTTTTPPPTTTTPTTTTTLPPTTPVPTTSTLPPTTAAPTTTTTTPPPTPPPTTQAPPSTTTVSNNMPPGPWQCVTGCNASWVTYTPSSVANVTIGNGTFNSPAGCTKLMTTCSTNGAIATIGYGSQGTLQAWNYPYSQVDSLLYCIQNNTTPMWTRFGTTSNPNALLQPITEAHCLLTLPPTTQPPTPGPTTPAPTPAPTTAAPTPAPTTPPPTPGPTTPPATPAPTTNGTVITCPDGRQFGPNQIAVIMGEIMKNTILNSYPNSSLAVQSYQDGINTHICNYISGPATSGK